MRKEHYLLLAVECGKAQATGMQKASLGLLLGGPWGVYCIPVVCACNKVPTEK